MSVERIHDRDELEHHLPTLRVGKIVGYTSGAFDLLHAGHVTFLEAAAKRCDLLIVGINSDRSVKWTKGDHRPVIGEADRCRIVAALRPVDMVFLFDEANNHENIRRLKPDLYLKGRDYTGKTVTSTNIMAAWGGRFEIIDTPQVGTTQIIGRVMETQHATATPHHVAGGPIVFLDRDGTLIADHCYVHEPDQVLLRDGVHEGLARLQAAGCRLAVVTNQGGIALGYFTSRDFFATNTRMMRLLAPTTIDRIYYCPHGINDGCDCRKPKPGMLLRGLRELNGTPQNAWMIGDQESDMEAARAAGVAPIHVRGAIDFSDAVDEILEHLQNRRLRTGSV